MKKHLPLLALGLILTAGFYTACQKQDKPAEALNPDASDVPELPYSKLVVIKDKRQENSISLKVSAADMATLNRYTEKSFELNPVYEEPLVSTPQQTSDATAFQDNIAVTESFIVMDEQLQDHVIAYELALAEEPGRVEDRGWVTSALTGHSCRHRMTINNWGPNITVLAYTSPWCVNTWTVCCSFNQGCQILNYCNSGGGIAAKISYWTPKRWSMLFYTNC